MSMANAHGDPGDQMAEVKIGAMCWNQYARWPSLLQAGIRADELEYASLWTRDHRQLRRFG